MARRIPQEGIFLFAPSPPRRVRWVRLPMRSVQTPLLGRASPQEWLPLNRQATKRNTIGGGPAEARPSMIRNSSTPHLKVRRWIKSDRCLGWPPILLTRERPVCIDHPALPGAKRRCTKTCAERKGSTDMWLLVEGVWRALAGHSCVMVPCPPQAVHERLPLRDAQAPSARC